MQHIKTLAAAFIILFVVASCKKEKVDTPAPPQPQLAVKQLTKYTWVFDNTPPSDCFYEYDQAGRVKTYKEQNRNYYFDYISVDKLIVAEHKATDNSLLYTYDCTLNEKKAIVKMTKKTASNVLDSDYDITYNSNGDLIKVRYVTASYTRDEIFEFVNGKAVSSRTYYDNVLYYDCQYFYDESQPNKNPLNHWYKWGSSSLFGNMYKYKLIEYKEIKANGQINWHMKFQNETDADGYITKQTIDYVHTGKKGVGTYSYQ